MHPLPSSYRDNDGFVFEHEGKVFRFIHPRYENEYALLMKTGLYDELTTNGWLIPHQEIAHDAGFDLPEGRTILPEQIPFISHPYEWSFAMWQDAALLTLQIAGASLKKGMLLKDATPFNVQFLHGKPVFIDTLSFERYEQGKPWIAYRQFCECFLAPLLLMHYCHPGTNKLFTVYPNGIPLDLLVSLLPKRSKWHLNTYLHIHLQSKITGNGKGKTTGHFSRQKLEVILQGLTGYLNKLSVKKMRSAWDDYYSDNILSSTYLDEKTKLVGSFLQDIEFETMLDLGANDGHFSLLFKNSKKNIVAIDADANCINELYCKIKREKINNIQPLVIDLVAPSPSIGWNNSERNSITERWKADLVMALALVHHLAIANNIPLPMVASWLKRMGQYLLIEFIPKEDEKLQLLLQHREDIFSDYSLPVFKSVFSRHYEILREETVAETQRVLFLMKLK